MGQIHGSGAGNWNNAAVVDSSLGPQQGRLWVDTATSSSISAISTFNSSTATLGSNAVFTGGSINMINYEHGIVNVFTDKSSAISGLLIQYSSDGTNWDHAHTYDLKENVSRGIEFNREAKFARITYRNGSEAQGTFRMQTLLSPSTAGPHYHQIDHAFDDFHQATLSRSILAAKKPDAVYANIQATTDSNLKVADAEDGLAIARGLVTGHDSVHKFGKNPDIQNAVTFEAVWNGGDDYTGFNATAPEVLEIFSSDAADTDTGVGARTLTMPRLLDGNYVKQGDVSITLSGTTSVYTTGSYLRCSRAVINTAGASGMNIGQITIRQSGTIANIMAVMPADYNQTMIACDTVPSGTTAYMTHMFSSLAGRSTAICDIRLLARPSGGVFNVKEEFSIATAGTGYVGRTYGVVPKGGFSAGTDIKVMASSNANSTGVAAGFDMILINNDL